MKDAKKYLKNMLLFVVLIALTFYIVLKNQSIEDIKNALSSVDVRYLGIGAIAMLIYFACEALNLNRTLKVLGEKTNYLHCLKYVFIGFFFSAITPAASGGQPVQIYFMHKDKLSGANSTLSLLILLCSYHLVNLFLAITGFIVNFTTLTTAMRIFFVIGLILNSSLFALYLIGIFSKRTSKALIKDVNEFILALNKFAVKILKKFKVKNVDAIEKKLESGLEKYQGSAKYIKSNIKMIIKTILITLVQMTAFFSISYWVYRSFGLSANNILQIIFLQAILYIIVCVLPLPGSVGVSEGVFMGLYSAIYTENVVGTAMMLHRGISFYLFVIISSIVVMFNIIKGKKDGTIKETDSIEDVE